MTLVFIISAPSGSGKSTLVNGLRNTVEGIDFSISFTTRLPRGSEQDGREYHYITRAEFQSRTERGEFLEYADVFGNYYGTARCFLDEAREHGHDLLLDIDVQGASQLQEKLPDAISVFILPPSKAELERRLRRRSLAEKVNNEEIIRRRLATASREIEKYQNYDYILVNDQLDRSIDALVAIVLSERLREQGRTPTPEERRRVELADQYRLENVRDNIQTILATFAESSTEAKPARS
ncbi:MAG TPA: guanylate kinase [Candidatus Acidoferrales bacterium]|nr:guanylate kinase [Candidatus Acidoferrales bacterium]